MMKNMFVKSLLLSSLALSLNADFIRDNTKLVVNDTKTGLMWQDDAVGSTMTWANAITTCENLTLGGYSDWRLPNIRELKSIVEELNLKTQTYTSQAVMAAMQIAIKQSGFFVYKMAAIIVNAVLKALFGRGLTFAGAGLMMRSISAFAGPVGWAITAAWTAYDVAGPAYRVTIPAVIQVAFLRQQYINKNMIEEEEIRNDSSK
jgi:hypothetical protein